MRKLFFTIPRKYRLLFGAVYLLLLLGGVGAYEYLSRQIPLRVEQDFPAIPAMEKAQFQQDVLGEIRQLVIVVSGVVLVILGTSTALMMAWLREVRVQQAMHKRKLEIEINQLAATIEAIPDLLFEMDVNGRYYVAHDTRDHLLPTSERLRLDLTVAEVYPPAQAEMILSALREAAERGVSRGTQIVLNGPDGKSWFELSMARKTTLPGDMPRVIVLSRDITEHKQVEAELGRHRDNLQEMVAARTAEAVKARMDAERANQSKSIFMANISHELRTPMHAILSFAKLGSERSANTDDASLQKLHQFFDRITQSGERLLMFVNDLLDLSKLEAGKMVLDIRPHELRQMAIDICEELTFVAGSKHIVLNVDAVPAGVMVKCDGDRIGQVLRNLLSNAIKFSPVASWVYIEAGFVEIPGRRSGDAPSPGVEIRVVDEGMGIPPDEFEAIFDNFVQSTKTATGAGGTGLGLSICREIILLHGGAIHAKNNPERGAALIFTLPLDHSGTKGGVQ